jgi:hypothetical protein
VTPHQLCDPSSAVLHTPEPATGERCPVVSLCHTWKHPAAQALWQTAGSGRLAATHSADSSHCHYSDKQRTDNLVSSRVGSKQLLTVLNSRPK